MAAAEMPMVYRYYEKSRTSAADGISFRGCLSDGGDIFSKSVENQGGVNRTFATGGRSWRVWQHYVTSHALNLFLTVDVVDQSLCGDNLLHELGERLSLEAFACGKILDHSGIEIYLDFIAVLNLPGCLGTLNDGQSDVNGIAVKDSKRR